MKIAVVGMGKAGLPLASVIADSGIDVIGVDIDKNRVDMINNCINPIPEEPGLQEILKKRINKNFIAVNSYEEANKCNVYIVIVPLFIDKNKKPDFSLLINAFKNISKLLKDEDLVVLETTVPPGTTSQILKPILNESNKKFYLAYSPERIMTGYSISRYKEFPKVVGGVDINSGRKAFEIYSRFCKKVNIVTNSETAELIKISEGIYRDVNIALANELFKVSEQLNINYYELQKNANHEFCHLHLPGNVGGHCIPVYPWFIINNYKVPLILKAREINDDMIEYYGNKIDHIVSKNGKVLVFGITYREGVKELAYSRSIHLIELLKNKAYNVFVFDPLYSKDQIESLGYNYSDDFNSMDGIIIMNQYEDYRDELLKMLNKVVDVKNYIK